MNTRNRKHHNNTRVHNIDAEGSNVIELAAWRRTHHERRGLTPVEVAVHVLAESGHTLTGWDLGPDDGDGGWAA
ncbi:hypothetical protein IU469_24805 [Nocardia puris]|uniref:hypothetical protein n=1 Tax=Nocardia puris TaxID=208602 RepID=UPI001893BBA5|nr:hypothetical protein [Nocardia puris]MBF6368913.1 hypothetical protein [Nocardia puris]